ncbi:MAG: carbohydrate-binding protein, partial [Kofleriaceae bacterium]
MRHAARLAAILILSAGCGDVQHGTPDGDPDGGPVTSCDPPGHFGVPTTSFVLPPRGTGFPYDDVQAAFPDVDWATLDRLYLPAGQYTHIQLGNLPRRDPARPLVITNQGGQVVIGFNPTGNYIWSFGGGANWVLTGRYDEHSQTGDAAFPGHACGHYDAAKYGIVSD